MRVTEMHQKARCPRYWVDDLKLVGTLPSSNCEHTDVAALINYAAMTLRGIYLALYVGRY